MLVATRGGLSVELCAVRYPISLMALYRLVCALGQQSLVAVLTRCGLPLPTYILADEKRSRCLTEKVYLPTIVSGRVLWHLGYTTEASTAAFIQSYQVFQRAAVAHWAGGPIQRTHDRSARACTTTLSSGQGSNSSTSYRRYTDSAECFTWRSRAVRWREWRRSAVRRSLPKA
jgi:hypothetical protein